MNIETRWQLLWRHIETFIRSTSHSWPTFATAVREEYERLIPQGGLVEWSNHRDTHQRMKLDAQTVRRFAHDYAGSTNHLDIPAEAEEALVFALGRLKYIGYQTLLTELAERYGMLPVLDPLQFDAGGDMQHAAAVMRESADAIGALAKLTGDDGVIDSHDSAKDLRHAQIQIREAMAALASAEGVVMKAMNEKGYKMPAAVRVIK